MMEYIVTYLALIANLCTCLLSYKFLTKEKLKISFNATILISFFSLISISFRILNFSLLIIILNIFFIFALIKKFFRLNVKRAFYYSLVIGIISLFSDAIISITISNSYLLNLDVFKKNYYLRDFLNIPVCMCIMLISNLEILRKLINNFYEKYIMKVKFNKIKLLFFLAIILVILIFFCINSYNEVNRVNHLVLILEIFTFAILFGVTLYLLYKEYQINVLNKNIIEENKYTQKIAKQDEEFKHNIINNLLGIKTVSNKKTNLLIDDLINSYQKDYKNITNINDLPNGIQSIIYRKAYEENIDNFNLIVNNNIKKELYDILTPRQYNNLCTIIGILFDNALDAVKNIKEKIIEIDFDEDDENIYFILKNSFLNVIDLEEIGKKNFTTKKNGRGIGVNYIKKLKNVVIKSEIINNMFVTKIRIKKYRS